VNTGKRIPEYQLQKVMGMPKGLAKSYFRARVNMANASDNFSFWGYEMKYFEALGTKIKTDLISELDSDKFRDFLHYAQDPDEFARMIIKIKGDDLNIRHLLIYTKNPSEIASIIGTDRVYNYLKWFEYYDTISIITQSRNPDEIIKMFIKIKSKNLTPEDIRILIKEAKNPFEIASFIVETIGPSLGHESIYYLTRHEYGYEIAKKIIDIKGKNLDSQDINSLIKLPMNREGISNIIINTKGDTLDSYDIYYLLAHNQNNDKIIRKIIELKGDQLNFKDIKNMFEYSQNYDTIIKLLLKAGVSKDDINKVIRVFNFNIDFIP
jgi:hypothetical protein